MQHVLPNNRIVFSPTGMGTSPAIVYITEVAKPELRGALIATCPTLASFGKNFVLRTLHSDICTCSAKGPSVIRSE
jgi:hypothetical protein